MLWLAQKEDPRTPETRDTLARLNIEHEVLSRRQTAARFPQFSLKDIEWSLYEPLAGMIIARRAVQAVVGEAIDKGVQYCIGRATKLNGKRRLDSLMTTSGDKFRAESFVFACGPWLPQIFPHELGKMIIPSRQEVFFFGAPGGNSQFAPPAMPAWYHFIDEVYGVPDLENRGPKVALDAHGPRMDPDSDSRTISKEGVNGIRKYVARRLPELAGAPIVETRVCQYENTANGDFLIDRHPKLENVWVAGGGSGHGFKHGPAVGEYVAGLVLGSGRVEERFRIAGRQEVRKRTVY
jgi:glycine/D-amino acid oxidase-like deaminating enzyme